MRNHYRDPATGAFADVALYPETDPGIEPIASYAPSAAVNRLYTPAVARGQGGASAVLGELARDADRHGVTIWLQASSYGEPDAMPQEALEGFYRGQGYEQDEIGLFVRPPQGPPTGRDQESPRRRSSWLRRHLGADHA